MNEKRMITSLDLPVEVFILFMINNTQEFTVIDMIRLLRDKHKMVITYNRMNQILNDFTEWGKLRKDVKEGRKGKPTAYYTFLKID